MCFIAYTFLNHLRNKTGLQHSSLIKAMDKMQLSEVEDDKSGNRIYMRSSITGDQQVLIDKLKLKVPNNTATQNAVNQCFT